MDFCWTQAQNEHYSRVLRLAQEKLNSAAKNRKHPHQFEREEWSLCGELGLLGLCVPTRYGGGGLNALTTARVIEAFGRGCEDMGLVFSVSAHLFACAMPIVEYGSEELKETILPRLCSGEWVGANAITEKEAGSDIFALKTQAIRNGESYVLTGIKSYVTNGPIADVTVIYALTNPKHGYLGITAFAVTKNTINLIASEPFSKMGLSSTPAGLMHLEECYVSVNNKLGNEGQGAQIFKRSMQWERACLFAAYLGMMERQLEQTITYAQKRRQFGKAIGKNQAISHQIADMKLRLEAARLLLYHACWLFDQGKESVLDVSMSKLAVSEAAIQSSLDAIQIHGAVGFTSEAGIERMLRDAIPSTIFSGTSEIHRDIIARELGL
ncbi:MAG: acyl-CoA dehydrogenase family protein [Mojavia pulchra JT2-VF2]|jgi:alkylation response protein AidB-like acyl-CoA dehydrogenase|uniref:Acyl-CoA dehydrogenase family protein n=1 Tax=Mojavia pulchra JT2-VF2 TaxID=287848 RepID=A0A951Q4X6_9NOST|nr:acyl-CoA dehydrogenase family protein [Mojavia pulchra JT2-VF2]